MNWFVGKYKMGRKYGFWDVSRDRRKAPITKSDRLLELLALVMGVVLLVLTGVFYVEAPETVPSHFNATGEADGWSGKYIYWVMAVVFLLSMVLCATAAYNRNLVNLPIRLKEPVFYRQIGLIGRMCRIMTLGMGLIWLAVLLAMSSEVLGFSSIACACMIGGSVALMLTVVLFYTLKIWWIGRNC
jgi:uncharacterized membrane protein